MKEKNSPIVQVAATVDSSVKPKADGGESDPAESKGKGGVSKPKGKNRHHGLTCYYCKKPNHIALNCRHRIAKEGETDANNSEKAKSNSDERDTRGTDLYLGDKKDNKGEGSRSGPIKCFKCGGLYHIATYCLKDVDF